MRSLAALFVPLLLACSRPEPPTLAPERVKVTGITTSQIGVDVTLEVTNPNSIDLVARSLTAHIVIAEHVDVGTVDIPVTTVFPANQTTKLEVPLSVQFTDLGQLAQLAVAGADLAYTVDGTVGLGGELLRVNLPYHLRGTVPRDQVTRAALKALPGLGDLR
jgi:LEA14-like dessication related protein